MEEWIKKSDVVKALNTEAREQFRLDDSYAYVIGTLRNVEDAISNIPSADRPQGEWIDEAISIIDDMQREGIVDYQQAWEYRMRARMKGADDE